MKKALPQVLRVLLQLFHLILAAGIFLVGIVEFSVETPIFDIFGRKGERSSLIAGTAFKNATVSSTSVGHILDAPILFLFLIYFLTVVWLKFRGRFSWLLTFCQVLSLVVFVVVNAGLSRIILDWRFFSTRAIAMFVDVLIFSFNWTVLILTLLHIRGWFPFKVNKKHTLLPYHQRTMLQRMALILWNFVALYLVLSLCFLVWFSKLYMSWACVRSPWEIQLMCQFTSLVQCWSCRLDSVHCDIANSSQCILADENDSTVIRCNMPLFTVPEFDMAFCVFNYNIGPFTFVTVFSYVGGIYFFMRTVLNALMKCLYTIIYIVLHCFMRHVHTHILRKEGVTTSVSDDPMKLSVDHEAKHFFSTDPSVSLLGPFPNIETTD